MALRAILVKVLGIILKPIWWLLMFAFSLIKHPWKIGALIIGVSLLFGLYSSIQERNISPLIFYGGGMSLGTSDTISMNLETLETQELSFWSKAKIWLTIFGAIYMFFILIYVFVWGITQISGNATPNATVYLISLVIVLLLSNLFAVLTTGELSHWFGLGGFVDLFQYLLANQSFIEGLINQTPYRGGENVSLNITNLTD